ncbi:sucrase-isomaltase, intestinal-like [Nymphalis io]|uniref:sucrase-isomaltase, intestinal-like n=1 Tax=Inachis io TaxID=171585 RepID=UPI002169D639|nr:sucrase-isomaltase, intestinal-like [Nymphalis io]XP_050349899.1 sucrase-isomaltase, intestinal-like [Nymphalis io]XP_050349900.1 sucrase-isomaltase, intestinal-like [Nymphalis io]
MIPHINEHQNEWDDTELKYQYQQVRKIKWYHSILLNRPLKVAVVFLLVAVVAPVILYRYLFFTSLSLPPSDGYSVGSCVIAREARLPCGVGFMPESQCHTHCCFDRNTHLCYHRIPSRFSYIMDQPWTEYITLQPRISTVPFAFQNSLPEIKLSINEQSTTHMVLTFYNSRNFSMVGNRTYNKDYSYEVSSPELNVIVNATQGTIFNMARGPLIASNNIWEIVFKLTNESMYGLGEIPLKTNSTKVIYNHDNGFSSIPLIYAKINDNFHGLLIDVSDPTEITIRTDNQIVVRSITSFGFKFHLFTGPEPKKIMQDVMKIIGYNKQLEYWMLGIHVCNELPDMDLSSFISNATRERMPYDSHCGHEPIIFNSNQCQNSERSNIDRVNAGATLVRNAKKKFVPHVSPHIRYIKEETNETTPEEMEDPKKEGEIIESCRIIPTFKDIMYRSQRNFELYKGIVNDYDVVYPSYDLNSEEFMDILWAYNTELDGVVLENNWPLDISNKTYDDIDLYLPYFNENFEEVFEHTPQWNLSLVNSSELYLFKHNKFGNNFASAFSKKMNNTPISSSSLWINGRFAINRQNIDASWTNLHRELIAAAIGGISGSWLWSSPICGDTENYSPDTQTSLCIKWYLAATYFPLIKIHSRDIPRYPFAFNGTHKTIITQALNRRLGLLPYFYTTLQEGPLLRPMFYQFPSSAALHDINSQFSVGESLLIAPNLQPMQSHVHIWLPPGTWYELWGGLKLKGNEGDPVTMTTTEADFLTFIRGGSILILQRDAQLTAEETRLFIPFSAIIALECIKTNETENCHASGKLYVTPDLTLFFDANEKNMTITAKGNDFDPICDINTGTWAYDLEYFSVYGLADEYNNYDNHREFKEFTDLCHLETSEIVINLIS